MVNPRLVAKIEAEETPHRLAVLIDADNAQAAVIEGLLAEVARFGEATVKRIYGDFTSPASAQWKKVLNKYAIKPMQQFAYTTGKNATDSTMIIDAMDLLYTRRFDGFCLVSSDSDFTGLALRIREEGLMVLGFGEEKTPEAFRNACHKFILTEVLRALPSPASADARHQADERPGGDPAAASAQVSASTKAFPRDFVLQALEQASDDSGWANLATVGSYLTKLQSDFDPRLYGFKKLGELIRSQADMFEVEERQTPGTNGKALYVRARNTGGSGSR